MVLQATLTFFIQYNIQSINEIILMIVGERGSLPIFSGETIFFKKL